MNETEMNRIIDLAKDSWGALTVITKGIKTIGFLFVDALEMSWLKGSDIWIEYKDNNNQDILKTLESICQKATANGFKATA